jgi:type VI secretion system Hcp family effector
VRLGGAVIVQQNVAMPHAVLLNEQEPQEYLALRYRDISWVHHVAGTTGYATWGEE